MSAASVISSTLQLPFRREREHMYPIAAIFDHIVLYRYSIILALSACAGICIFMACCSYCKIPVNRAAGTALGAVILALLLSRLVYWYSRPDTFTSLLQAFVTPGTKSFALSGAFAGCGFSVLLFAGKGRRIKMLDCMCIAGCWAIALGRLGCFFTATDRGQIMMQLTGLPWAWPVANASGQLEYRFATFLFQSGVAAVLGLLLMLLFRKKKWIGDVSLLFLLVYCASQVLLDSTRYDSLYLRSNGFVSIVQILSAVAMAAVLVIFSIFAVQNCGFKKWMIPAWIGMAGLFGCAGYMEYYVQRHGREAAFAYSVMGTCLACIVLLGLIFWHQANKTVKK